MIEQKAHLEILEYMAVENPKSFNVLKALEEAVEFQEVLCKLQTKHPNNKKRPDKDELIKEFGDVIYRGLVAIKSEQPDLSYDEIFALAIKRIEFKLDNLIKYKSEGKYQGGL